MGKAIDRDRAMRLMGVYMNNVDFEGVSDDTAEWAIQNPQDAGAQFSAFLRNRGRLIVGKPQVIKLDTMPFNPEEFLGKGWSFWRGPADGDGLTGDVAEDLDEELDLGKIELKPYLNKGEDYTTGEERLLRIASAGDNPLGTRSFQTFWKTQGLIPEEWKKLTNGNTTYVFFDKVVLRGPGGNRYTLYLCWDDDEWDWDCRWLDRKRSVNNPSAVRAS